MCVSYTVIYCRIKLLKFLLLNNIVIEKARTGLYIHTDLGEARVLTCSLGRIPGSLEETL